MTADFVVDPTTLRALRTLVREHIGDFIYDIRGRAHEDESYTGSSWDHPRVKAYSDAVGVIEAVVHRYEESE